MKHIFYTTLYFLAFYGILSGLATLTHTPITNPPAAALYPILALLTGYAAGKTRGQYTRMIILAFIPIGQLIAMYYASKQIFK